MIVVVIVVSAIVLMFGLFAYALWTAEPDPIDDAQYRALIDYYKRTGRWL